MKFQKNLSGMESTPEFQRAVEIAKNRGRGEHTFYTTLGHIITKILDMDITFTLPDGTQYNPFRTADEVRKFFGISGNDLSDQPNWRIMNHLVYELYKKEIRPREGRILDPQQEFMQDFFRHNVWGVVNDSDTIDTLISEIRALIGMGIEGINEYVCEDTIEWIIMNVIGNGQTLADWENMNVDERNELTVEFLDKDKFTEYFADQVVGLAWRKHPSNSHKMMDIVMQNIRALYIVDASLEERVGKVDIDSFRNTRYP